MIKKVYCLSAALLVGSVAAPKLVAQTQAQYKIEIEAEAASGSWNLGIGAEISQGSLVWADFNGNGQKDAGESWSLNRADKDGVCRFSQRRTNAKLTIYGPVTTLLCAENTLVSLNTGANPELKNLAANANSLSLVNLTSNKKLERVNLADNQLARITVTGLSALVDLRLNGNSKMNTLNFQGVTALEKLDVSDTKVSTITNANFSALKGINLSGVSDFDFSILRDAAVLEDLGLAGCKTPTLDLSRHPKLRSLWAPTCELEHLDFSSNPDLVQVMLSYNKLTVADFSNNMKLRKIYLENNSIEDLKLPGAGSRVDVINISGVKTLTSLDLSQQPKLWVLQLDGSGITSLDLSANPLLVEVTLSETAIKELDLSNLPDLNTLNVGGCKELTKLDLSNTPELSVLYCGKSGLKEIDLTNCTKLTEFHGEQNGFNELVFNSSKLEAVTCSGNRIKGEAMNRLINSLPRVSSGRFIVVDLSVSGDENKCTTEQVNKAKGKGWQVLDRNIEGSSYKPYAGSDTDPLDQVAQSLVKIYPTVASTFFNVEGAAGSEYYIYTMAGELVARGQLVENLESISVSGLPAATYVVRLGAVEGAFRVQVVD